MLKEGMFKSTILIGEILSVVRTKALAIGGILLLFGLVAFSFYFFSDYHHQINFVENKNSQDLFLGPGQKFSLESPDFLLIENCSLRAALTPCSFSPQVLGALVGYDSYPETRLEIAEYIVEPGDSLWSIAAKFDITLNTLLWANDLNQNSIVQPGQKLIILPVSGVIHHVKTGDTISGIAQKYQAKAGEIISFNKLSNEADIFVGDILVVPNGVMPSPSTKYAPAQVPMVESYFICPISLPCQITQGLHWYNAVDFSHGKCGELVYAAAGGEVLKVKYGYNQGAGNYVRILHPNGVVTHYGHLSQILVNPGQPVSQGDVIGLTGYSGYTIPSGPAGCHLHFDVLNVPRGTNPFLK